MLAWAMPSVNNLDEIAGVPWRTAPAIFSVCMSRLSWNIVIFS